MLVSSLPRNCTKGWLVTYTDTLTIHAGLFMTSLIQTAGHKMAALTVVFQRLSNVDYKQAGPEI